MAKLKDLKVTIGLSKKGLTKLNGDLRRVKSNFRRNFGEIQGMVQNTGRNLTAGLTAPLVGLGAAAVKSAVDLEKLETSFVSLTGGAQEAADMMANLNEFTAKTPFQIEGVANAARQLIASGTGLDEVNDQLQFLGDIAATSGVSIEEIAAIFAKVNAKGKVELENLNQLAERGIPIFKALADATGLPADELGAGAVSVEQFNETLSSFAEQGGFAAGAMERLSETAAGKFSTALDNLKLAGAELAQSLMPTISKVLDGVTKLAQGFAGLSQGTKNLILVVGMGAAALGPALMATSALMTSFSTVAAAMGVSMTAALGPVGLLAAAIGVTLAGAFTILASAEKRSRKRLEGLDKTVQELYGNIEKGSEEAARSVAVIDGVFERLDSDDVIDLTNANGELKKRLSALRSESLKTAQQMFRQGKITDINAEATARFRMGLGTLRSEYDSLVHVVKEDTEKKTENVVATKAQAKATEELVEMERSRMVELGKVTELQSLNSMAAVEANHKLKGSYENLSQGLEPVMGRFQQLADFAKNQLPGFFQGAFSALSQGTKSFGEFMMETLKQLLIRLTAMAATFAALSIMFPGSQAVAGGFGKFMAGGMGIPAMAEGGLFTGASLAYVGEGPGTSAINPEVVAPLDKLQQMMGGGNVTVTGRLDGRDILLSSERSNLDRNRVRGF